MYSKPKIVALSRAVGAIQQQTMSTKGLAVYADVLQTGNPVNQSVTAAAYEADE